MIFHVMTLFPDLIEQYMTESIMKRASEERLISVKTWNIRDFSANKHKKVDDYPYGGGAGMLMTPQPIMDCYRHIEEQIGKRSSSEEEAKRVRVVYLSPKGECLNQRKVVELSQEKEIILLCGHYEGIDQRVIDQIVTDEISIGDYVLTGGELPALVLIDSVARYVSGVLGTEESLSEESFSEGLLEYPQYTRPPVYEGAHVPKVLLSGDHQKIEAWRRDQSIRLTKQKRPDLLLHLSERDRMFLEKYEREENKMKKRYEVIFFDADDTLLDFAGSEGVALQKTMESYGTICEEIHRTRYSAINQSVWRELEEGIITQEELKIERFRRFLSESGFSFDAQKFSDCYLKYLSMTDFLLDGAKEILIEFQKTYRLAMITNGIAEVQKGRLSRAGIARFFEAVIISEEVGFSKPSVEIFEYAMKAMDIQDKSAALMVGDSLTSDMAGAIAFGMDSCWLNLKNKQRPESVNPTYEIGSLHELKNIL